MRRRLAVIAAAFTLCVAAAALAPGARAQGQTRTRQAQTPAPAASPQTSPRTPGDSQRQPPTPAEASTENDDLSITARVTADSLVFRKVPNPKVEFTGRPERATAWEAERQNLPEQVQPGVTYRDIGITLRIKSVFADIERIVAEALGERPMSDDTPAPPNQVAPPRPAPQSPPPSPPQQGAPPARTEAPRRKGTVKGRGE